MPWLGRSIAAVGVVLIVLPVIAALLWVSGRGSLPTVLAYAPTFVLLGILVFVVGIGIRTFGGR